MNLSRYNYKAGEKARIRRNNLQKAILDLNFDTVFEQLQEMKQETEKDWKRDRIDWDLSFLRERSDRYQTSMFSKNQDRKNSTQEDTRNSRNFSALSQKEV